MPFKDRGQKRPKQQEREVAKDIGGKRVPFSGSLRFNPGDASNDEVLVDAKTTSKSFSLNTTVLNKLHLEAASKGKQPALQVELTDMPAGRQKWAVIPWSTYLDLTKGK